MASAVEQLTNNFNTDQPVSYYDYYNAYGKDHYQGYGNYLDLNPDGFLGKVRNFFTGQGSSAEREYQNYLAGYEYNKNAKATAAANAETYAREDSQVQRLMKDYAAAGLNPYSLLTGGNLSSGVVSSQAQRPSYKRGSYKKQKDQKSDIVNSAMRAIMMLAFFA